MVTKGMRLTPPCPRHGKRERPVDVEAWEVWFGRGEEYLSFSIQP